MITPWATGYRLDNRTALLTQFSPVWQFAGLIVALLLSCSTLFAQQPATNNVRFLAVDVFVDSKGKPLAAYQLQFSVTNGNAKIVGVEGGEHPSFREAPHYDPKAIQRERVIIAAFSTELANKLPNGKTRVATIHLQVSTEIEPHSVLNLQLAAGPSGDGLTASASSANRATR